MPLGNAHESLSVSIEKKNEETKFRTEIGLVVGTTRGFWVSARARDRVRLGATSKVGSWSSPLPN